MRTATRRGKRKGQGRIKNKRLHVDPLRLFHATLAYTLCALGLYTEASSSLCICCNLVSAWQEQRNPGDLCSGPFISSYNCYSITTLIVDLFLFAVGCPLSWSVDLECATPSSPPQPRGYKPNTCLNSRFILSYSFSQFSKWPMTSLNVVETALVRPSTMLHCTSLVYVSWQLED